MAKQSGPNSHYNLPQPESIVPFLFTFTSATAIYLDMLQSEGGGQWCTALEYIGGVCMTSKQPNQFNVPYTPPTGHGG